MIDRGYFFSKQTRTPSVINNTEQEQQQQNHYDYDDNKKQQQSDIFIWKFLLIQQPTNQNLIWIAGTFAELSIQAHRWTATQTQSQTGHFWIMFIFTRDIFETQSTHKEKWGKGGLMGIIS